MGGAIPPGDNYKTQIEGPSTIVFTEDWECCFGYSIEDLSGGIS